MSWETISATNSCFIDLDVGRPIMRLSSIDPTQPLEIINLLSDNFELKNGILYDLAPKYLSSRCPRLPIKSLYMEDRILNGVSLSNFDNYDRINESVFDFFVVIKGDGWHGCRGSSYAVYIDRSFREYYLWTMQFNSSVRSFFSNARFLHLLGICSDCKESIGLKDYVGNVVLFRCRECRAKKRNGVVLGRGMKEKIQLSPPTLSPDQVLRSSKKLSIALYKIYHGRCQYCADPKPLSREEMHIEHIIPSSVSLDDVWQRLCAIGVSEDQAKNFCAIWMPPKHDCVLNYTLSCAQHNNRKSGRILHPAALESLLRQAKQKAKNILKYVAEN